MPPIAGKIQEGFLLASLLEMSEQVSFFVTL